MATRIQELETAFTYDDKSLKRGFRETEQQADSWSRRMSQKLGNIQSVLSGRAIKGDGFLPGLSNISNIIQGIPQVGHLLGALVSPLTQATEAGIRYNAFLETAKIGLEGVAGSSAAAEKHLAALQKFGERTPFEFTGLVNSSRYMTTFGFQLRDHIPLLTTWGNAVAASGNISEDALEGVVRAFGQMRTLQRVNSEEMNQLAERGIPAWELLAKAIGKSVAETRKLAERGRLNGGAAVEAMTAMMDEDPRFKNQMDRMSKTLTGRLSNLEDIKGRALGIATKDLSGDLSDSLDIALKRSDLAEKMASRLNTVLAPVGGMIKATVKGSIGGGMTDGLSEGIIGGFAAIKASLPAWAYTYLVEPVEKQLGIKSPSRVFMEMGYQSAEGYAIGFKNGLQGSDLAAPIDEAIERAIDTSSRGMKKWGKQLQAAGGEPFINAVEEMGGRLNANPASILNVMAFESRFNPRAKNPKGSASGLIQFTERTARGLGTSTAAIRAMTAMQQLELVEKYLAGYARQGADLSSDAGVYGAVAGRVVRNPNQTIYQRGRDGKNYSQNTIWDVDKNGIITASELARLSMNTGGFSLARRMTPGGLSGMEAARSQPVPVVVTNLGGIGANIAAGGFVQGDGGGANAGIHAGAWERYGVLGEATFMERELRTRTDYQRFFAGGGDDLAGGIPFDSLDKVREAMTHTISEGAEAGYSKAKLSTEEWEKRVVSGGRDTWMQLRAGFEDEFFSAFTNIEGGFMGMTGRLGVGFSQMLQQMAMESLKTNLGELIFGGQGGGGLLRTVIGFGANLLGAAFGGGAAGLLGGGLPKFDPGAVFGKFEQGGDITPFIGKTIEVHKNEKIVPLSPGYVIPSPETLMKMAQSSYSPTYTNNNTYAPQHSYTAQNAPQQVHHHTHNDNRKITISPTIQTGNRVPDSYRARASQRQIAESILALIAPAMK